MFSFEKIIIEIFFKVVLDANNPEIWIWMAEPIEQFESIKT